MTARTPQDRHRRAAPAASRTAPEAEPIDREVIGETIARARTDRPDLAPPDEMLRLRRLAEDLRGHIALLLPEAEQHVDRLWRGSTDWYTGRTHLDYIRDCTALPLPDYALPARRRLREMAAHCAWLLERIPQETGR